MLLQINIFITVVGANEMAAGIPKEFPKNS